RPFPRTRLRSIRSPEGESMSLSARRFMPSRGIKPALEQLEDRAVPTVQAFFGAGILTVLGDADANNIRVFADSAGNLQVTNNNQAVPIQKVVGGATLAETNLIVVSGDA